MLFQWKVRVYYEDTDASGVVYHARYITFYERARTEMLRKCGFHQQHLLSEGVAFVVHSMTVKYLAPARLEDMLTIQSKITKLRGASLKFEQCIFNSQGTRLSEAEVLIACVDSYKLKSIALPKSIVTEFKQ